MSISRSAFLALITGISVTACATGANCREASPAERMAFGAIIAHDEDRLASMMAPGDARNRLAASDPVLEAQIFGQRMGDPSVRTIVMQPPLCVYDEAAGSNARTSYIFQNGRLEQLQAREAGFGEPGRDHAKCQFQRVDGQWKLADACVATFQAAPAS